MTLVRPVKSVVHSSADPYVQMKLMQEQMQKSFAHFNSMFADDPFFKNAFSEMGISPMSDIKEDKNSYIVELNIPGAQEKKLDIKTEGNILHVKAVVEKSSENKDETYVQRERYWQKFERVFTLPSDADLAAIKSDYKDGVLKIIVPKKS